MEGILNTNVSTTSPASTLEPFDDILREPGYIEFQEELRCLILNTARTVAPSREASPTPTHASTTLPHATQAQAQEQHETRHTPAECQSQFNAVLSVGHRLTYLKNWVAEVAPWLDMFDSNGAFTVHLPNLAQTCPALLYAMLALSARQLERKNHQQKSSFDSLELYQQAIRDLGPLMDDNRKLEQLIPTCVILCCLEMMSASPRDWRRHLEGCAALFNAFGVNGFSGGMLQSAFWCYARMGKFIGPLIRFELLMIDVAI